jgi:arylsulfatase A
MIRTILIALLSASTISAAERPPNVVIIFADDLGYADVGCFGNKVIRTPNIDRIAAEGIRFTDFYVAQAVCSASRTALLTGCYPNRLGILGALGPAAKHGIHERETTLAQLLKTRGYATAIYGKWHLGHHPEFLPTRHGFDEYLGLPYSNDMWPKHPTSKFPELPLIEGEKTIELNPDQTKLTTIYTERAVKFIERSKDKPFFMYLPHAMPHVPLHVSEKHRGKSKAGVYGDVIEELDWSVGEVLAVLKKHDLERDTIVIFTSDNGPWLSYGNHAGSAGSLREGKGTTFEGGVRVPFVARWPGHIPVGSVCQEPAMTIDLFPTLAAVVGAQQPKLSIDGKNIGPLLTNAKGAKSPHDLYAFYWGQELQAVRAGNWKLHFAHAYQHLQEAGKDGSPGKYVQARIDLSLFDLEADVGETTNVAAANPGEVARLQELADRVRADLGDVATKQVGKGVRTAGIVQAPK